MGSIEKTQEQLMNEKRSEIESKFGRKLAKGDFRHNATFQKIILSLVYGENPYSIIEQLVLNQEEIIKELIDIKINGNHTVIIRDK